MSRSLKQSSWRRLRARFWTGPVAHLLGGGLDLLGALVYAARHRRRAP